MPVRPLNRQQAWLLPPTLGELIPEDHPARFVAEFVDGLDDEVWIELGINMAGDPLGTPAYHPRALLGVWLYGFMTGIRSSRKLEAACRDQVSYLWLTAWQRPDHNTLWRFYQAHRQAMRRLFKYTVATAVEMKLIDLAVQALDGTKVAANAAGDRTYGATALKRLLERTEIVIAELEAQNEAGNDPVPPRLPEERRRRRRCDNKSGMP
ncbi:MAG: transposase [Chloroflexi bacterium]|nr:transposase [Chloroflexota bacterium]